MNEAAFIQSVDHLSIFHCNHILSIPLIYEAINLISSISTIHCSTLIVSHHLLNVQQWNTVRRVKVLLPLKEYSCKAKFQDIKSGLKIRRFFSVTESS